MITAVKILPRMAVHSLANDDYYSKSVLASLPEHSSIRIISINGYDEPFLTEAQIDNLRRNHRVSFIHSMRFDDIGGEIWESIVNRKGIDRSQFVYFDEDMAKSIIDFIGNYEPTALCELEDELLIVHCHAGISRSSAVGSAIACKLKLSSVDFRNENPNIDPNKYILAGMLKALDISPTEFSLWRSSVGSRLRLVD